MPLPSDDHFMDLAAQVLGADADEDDLRTLVWTYQKATEEFLRLRNLNREAE